MKLIVSNPPHWHAGVSEKRIFMDFTLALLPALFYAVLLYGIDAVRVVSLSVSTIILWEIFFNKLFKKRIQTLNGNAIYYGLLFALILPPSVPWWFIIIGGFLIIFIGREIFGGIGCNPFNPVLVGFAILRISWPVYLNYNLASVNYPVDFDIHFPLTVFKNGGFHLLSDFKSLDLLLGKQVGGMGAAAIFLILIGGLYLLVRKRISWEIPFFFILGILSMSAAFWLINPGESANPIFHLLTGNAMICIFFMANDYSSSPVNFWGKVIFGLGCGFLTVIFRVWSIHGDGVVFALLIMNLFTPLLDKIKKHKPVENYFDLEKG
jgi:electron transport complex protein RnfD